MAYNYHIKAYVQLTIATMRLILTEDSIDACHFPSFQNLADLIWFLNGTIPQVKKQD